MPQSSQVEVEALAACATEPIHTPGSIQPRGVLVATDAAFTTVLFLSANASTHFARPLESLLGRSPVEVLGEDFARVVATRIQATPDGLVVFVTAPDGSSALIHRHDGRIVVELLDERSSGDHDAAASGPTMPTSERGQAVGPLHALTSLEGFSAAAAHHSDVSTLADQLAREVRRLTHYDRVMVYAFDAEGHGAVIAEAKRADLGPFLGLHYPASDIPPQARLLYLRTRLRILHAVGDEQVPILGAGTPDAARPLDLSLALLRSFSPIHLEYLTNMGVEATLTLSLIVDGRLWGLIACHHATPRWIPHAARVACNVLSEVASLQISVQGTSARANARAHALAAERILVDGLTASDGAFDDVVEHVQALVACSGVAIVRRGRILLRGETPPEPRVEQLVHWLAAQPERGVVACDHLAGLIPELADLADVASGVLAARLGGSSAEYILWFRAEHPRTVRWGGEPAKTIRDGSGAPRLSPRSSFAEWVEERRGRSEAWSAGEVAVAASVRSALIEVVLDLLETRSRIVELDLVRIRHAVECASDAIVVTDAEGRPTFTNRAFQDLVGIGLADLSDVGALVGVPLPTAATVSTDGLERHVADGALHCRGVEIPVAVRVDPILDADGRFVGAMVAATDLRARRALEDERARMESKLAQTQKLESLGVLAGGIAHDFNNLLTTIVANSSIAQEDLPAGSASRAPMLEIDRAAQHAASLCREMLAYAGRARREVAPLDLNELVSDMGNLLRTGLGAGCRLSFGLADSLPVVEADATQLRQVVMNLVVNASDAIGVGEGRIEVATRARTLGHSDLAAFSHSSSLAEGRYLELEVRDEGVGMDAETIAHIFDPFFTTKFAGRGLGLAAVQGILHGHRGAVRVESSLGKGSTFFVILPAAEGQTARSAIPVAKPFVLGEGRSALVVDDNPKVRAVAVRILERAGFRVVEGEDGQAAIDAVAATPDGFAVVVSDITMPRVDGVKMLARLRELAPKQPVVLFSGYTEEEISSQLASDPFLEFVPKPFTPAALLGAVERLLGPERTAPRS